ncbi:hypothetical protein CC86DRAFT_405010 [Ophiobolus disseminans]|uniref:Ubiquitin-like protease family profile domain-containing protein n=1 Tax=Ophiobolus disseminans TaxID=1469910 RepID=A0A6A7A3T7_9PLEO|nr:hypothetical protein CC86DRAFT_405010 [Ophiobolus disseminans]
MANNIVTWFEKSLQRKLLTDPYWQPVTPLEQLLCRDFFQTPVYLDTKAQYDRDVHLAETSGNVMEIYPQDSPDKGPLSSPPFDEQPNETPDLPMDFAPLDAYQPVHDNDMPENEELVDVLTVDFSDLMSNHHDADIVRNAVTQHLSQILEASIEDFRENKDGQFPLTLPPITGQGATPFFFEHVRGLSAAGEWTEHDIIDWLLRISPRVSEADVLLTCSPIYSRTIRSLSLKGLAQQNVQGMTVKIVEFISNPPGALDPGFDPDVSAVLFPWNPTGTHWVLVKASVIAGERKIGIYDSMRRGKHAGTWRRREIVPIFLQLIGEYHTLFEGSWTHVEIYSTDMVEQDHDDCGILAVWAARELLIGTQILPEIRSAARPATVQRTHFLAQIRAAVDGSPPDMYELNYIDRLNWVNEKTSEADSDDENARDCLPRWLDDDDKLI